MVFWGFPLIVLKLVINLLWLPPPFVPLAVFVDQRSFSFGGGGEAVLQLAQVASGVFLVKARLVP
jgi:hypothetical protein